MKYVIGLILTCIIIVVLVKQDKGLLTEDKAQLNKPIDQLSLQQIVEGRGQHEWDMT